MVGYSGLRYNLHPKLLKPLNPQAPKQLPKLPYCSPDKAEATCRDLNSHLAPLASLGWDGAVLVSF